MDEEIFLCVDIVAGFEQRCNEMAEDFGASLYDLYVCTYAVFSSWDYSEIFRIVVQPASVTAEPILEDAVKQYIEALERGSKDERDAAVDHLMMTWKLVR